MEVEGMEGGVEGDLEGMHGEEGVGQGLWELTWERPGSEGGSGAERRNHMAAAGAGSCRVGGFLTARVFAMEFPSLIKKNLNRPQVA